MLGSDDNTGQIEASDNHLPQLGTRAFRGADSLQQVVGMVIQENARLRQVHSSSNTPEKSDPEFVL